HSGGKCSTSWRLDLPCSLWPLAAFVRDWTDDENPPMNRVTQVARKELIQIKRDRWLVRMLVLSPLFQLLIYGYVVATEIRSLPLVVLVHSSPTEGRRLIARLVSSGYFTLEGYADSLTAVTKQLDSGSSLMAVVIPDDYAENVRRGVEAKIQLLVDGTN